MEGIPTESRRGASAARQEDTGRRLPRTSQSPGRGMKKASTEPPAEAAGEGTEAKRRQRKPRPKKKLGEIAQNGSNGAQTAPTPHQNGSNGGQANPPLRQQVLAPEHAQEPQLQRRAQQQEQQRLERVSRAATLSMMEASAAKEREQALAWFNEDGPLSDVGGEAENVGRQVRNLWENTRPSFERLSKRSRILADIKLSLDRRWPGCGLEVTPFGSSLTGLLEATSDLDLCLLDPTRPHGVGTPANEVRPLPESAKCRMLDNPGVVGMAGVPDYYSVKLIARALEHQGGYSFREVNPIWHAAVPIVKFVHAPTNIACDVNVNDSFGLRNSHMIKAYIDLAPDFVGPLLFCIKKWASRRDLNDPAGAHGPQSMNSYSVCLFALQYLQLCGVLPNLQSKALLEALGVPASHVWQRPKVSRPKRRKPDNTAQSTTAAQTVATQSSNGTNESASTLASDMAAFETTLTSDTTQQEEESNGQTSTHIPSDPQTGSRRFDTSFVTLVTENDRQTAERLAQPQFYPHRQPYVADWMRTASRSEKDAALGRLLSGFFAWFDSMDFDKCGISLREGHPVRRTEELGPEDTPLAAYPYVPMWDPRWEQHPFLCQDPFILDRNTCAGINPKTRTLFLQEVKRAVEILKSATGSDTAARASVLYDLLTDERYTKLQEKHQREISSMTEQEKQRLSADAAVVAAKLGRGKAQAAKQPQNTRFGKSNSAANRQSSWRGTSRMPRQDGNGGQSERH